MAYFVSGGMKNLNSVQLWKIPQH